MQSTSSEDLVCSKTKSSQELLSREEEQSVSVVRVRRAFKAGQEHLGHLKEQLGLQKNLQGLQKELQGHRKEHEGVHKVHEGVSIIEHRVRRGAISIMGREELSTMKTEAEAARLCDQVEEKSETWEEQEVEVIKVRGRGVARRERRKQHHNPKAKSEDEGFDQKTLEVGSGTTPSDLERKPFDILEIRKAFDVLTEIDPESKSLDLNVNQDDQLESKKLELAAKSDDLGLRDSKTESNLVEDSVQSTSSAQVVVEVEDMTSEDYFHDPLGHFAVHEELLKDELRMQGWQEVSSFSSTSINYLILILFPSFLVSLLFVCLGLKSYDLTFIIPGNSGQQSSLPRQGGA